MKITGPTGAPPSSPSRPGARAAGGFSISGSGQASSAPSAQPTASTSGVAGLSSLMALQGVEDATERRRRAVRRGGGLLDRLEELKLAMLEGRDGLNVLQNLARAVAEERPADADPVLTGILDQIDLRAAVELAKADRGIA